MPAERTRWYSYTYASRHTISLGHGAGHIIPGAEMTAGFRRTTGSGTRTRAKTILRFNSKATSGLNRFTALLMLTSDSDAWCPQVYGITHAYLRLGRLVPTGLRHYSCLPYTRTLGAPEVDGGRSIGRVFLMCWLEVHSSIAPTVRTFVLLVFRTTRTPFYPRVCMLLRQSSYRGDRG